MIVVMREYNVMEIESKILFPNYPTLIIKVGVLFLGCAMNMREEQITKKISPTKILKSRIAIALPVIIIIVTGAISTIQFLSIPTFAQDETDGVRLDIGGASIAVGGEGDVISEGDEVGIAVVEDTAAGFGDALGLGIGGENALGFGDEAGIAIGGREQAIGLANDLGIGIAGEEGIDLE